MTTCRECYFIELPSCPEAIDLINAAINAGEVYTWEITDVLGNHYRGAATSSPYGVFSIDATVLPDGLLIAEMGTFKLEIFNSDGEKVELSFEAKQYTCVQFSLYHLEGEPASAIIE